MMKGPLLGLFVVTAAAAAGFGFLNRRKKPEARAKRISEPKDNERLLADNAGWDDEKLLFGMSKSRETMFNEVCARSAAVLGAVSVVCFLSLVVYLHHVYGRIRARSR